MFEDNPKELYGNQVFNENQSRWQNSSALTTRAKGMTLGWDVWEHALPGKFLKFGPLKMHFCIQVAAVDLHAAVFSDATSNFRSV